MGVQGRERVRLCVLLPRLTAGGIGAQVLGLLRSLDRSRYNPHVCCLSRGDAGMEETVRHLVGDLAIMDFRPLTAPAAVVRLVRYLRAGRFDVLHTHLRVAGTLGRIAGIMAGIPVLVTTEHGEPAGRGACSLLERVLVRSTAMRICMSEEIARDLMRSAGTPPEKIIVIPSGIDPVDFLVPTKGRAEVRAEFGWGAGDPLVLSVGRLDPASRHTLLVESITLLRRDFPAVRCLVAGEGEDRAGIEAAIARLGLRGIVRLAGARRDIPDLLAAADLFVVPGAHGVIPLSLLEAMAAGTPVVCVRSESIRDAFSDGESALLVEPGDAKELAGALGRVLGNRELARRLSQRAKSVVEKGYDISTLTRRIEAVYKRAVAGVSGGSRR